MKSLQIARTFIERLRGLMGRKSQWLYIPECQSIHTFFMKRALNLYWINHRGEVIRRDRKVKPWQIRRCAEAYGVVECESGQSLVEFALLLPLLILLCFGFLQLSLAFQASSKLQHVTFHALRVGSITNDDAKITGAIETFYEPGEIEITLENQDSGGQLLSTTRRYGDQITLNLIYQYPLDFPLLGMTHIPLFHTGSIPVLCQNQSHPHICE